MKYVLPILNKQFICFLLLATLLSVTPLIAETFDIRAFSDPQKYGWTDEDMRLEARDNLFLRNMLLDDYAMYAQSPLKNALKSSVAPGWGHFSINSYTKGQVFLGVQLGLLGSSLYFREKSSVEYKKYQKATQIDDIKRYYDNAVIPYRESNLLLGLFIVVWGYTIYDVIIETNNYNQAVWNDLIEPINEPALKITPTGISYRF
ncbi:MAG: hypothetical protein WCX83_02715 [Candidatus Cloacimonas sp.]|nr:hypothetical protein [Candidatus Cloacimonadota bacterium]